MSGKKSRDKGQRFERLTCNLLGQYWCGSAKLSQQSCERYQIRDSRFFIRSPKSGGGVWLGDVIPNPQIAERFPAIYQRWVYSIECKNVAKFSLDHRGTAHSFIKAWTEQAEAEAGSDKVPLVIFYCAQVIYVLYKKDHSRSQLSWALPNEEKLSCEEHIDLFLPGGSGYTIVPLDVFARTTLYSLEFNTLSAIDSYGLAGQ